MVDVIKPGGLIDEFNSEHPDQAIREGDVIAEANGIAGSWENVKEEVFSGRSLGLKLERGGAKDRLEWMMEIDSGFHSLGLDFDAPSALEKTSLRIALVHDEGVIPKHNASNPAIVVKRGDLIVQVNEESASALAMQAEIQRASSQAGQPLKLYIARRKFKRQVSFAKSISMDFDEAKIMSERETAEE
jgi:hypothetical protein